MWGCFLTLGLGGATLWLIVGLLDFRRSDCCQCCHCWVVGLLCRRTVGLLGHRTSYTPPPLWVAHSLITGSQMRQGLRVGEGRLDLGGTVRAFMIHTRLNTVSALRLD